MDAVAASTGRRSWPQALLRGLRGRCPQCGEGRLFQRYVATRRTCATCGLALDGHRADDAPPYVTIIVVGHAAIPLALAAKQLLDPPLAVQFAFWTPAMMVATWLLLPASKGALIGLQWANRMHGFGDGGDDDLR
ncbi:MAG: DUF983 domain-containing protein [Parvularculaceae bacterium]